jgi:cytochrome c-type biogenesis protein CcmH/NrfG
MYFLYRYFGLKVSQITALAKGNVDIEIVLLEEQVEENTDDVEVYLQLSSLYRQKGNYHLAWTFLNKAESLLPRTL